MQAMATVHADAIDDAGAIDVEVLMPWSDDADGLAEQVCGNTHDADDNDVILVVPPDVPKVPLTAQELKERKRQAHMLRNRVSAKRSRANRKEHITNLETRVVCLSQEIQDLKNKCKNLEVDNKEREYYNKYYS